MDEHRYAIADQSGRTVLITGANSGIGLQAARRLAEAGANVVLACRDPRRAERAVAEVAGVARGGEVSTVACDLASLASVRAAAARVRDQVAAIDVLVNNAGVMAIPRRVTEDGFEAQLATNHLGHFALTGLLVDLVGASGAGRVVTLSSEMHTIGRMRFSDLDGERFYQRWLAYGQSKLANLLFTLELQRRLEASGSSAIAVAAHPGWAATNLQTTGRGLTGGAMKAVVDGANRLLAQSPQMGALPTLHAATSPHVTGGGYYGPGGLFGMRGYPVPCGRSRAARDGESAHRLWAVSEERTGVVYPLDDPDAGTVSPSPAGPGTPGSRRRDR
jgi:NAD(P)-dependent dehydrogenase (short-subunit alcohol dehydrogenase family)